MDKNLVRRVIIARRMKNYAKLKSEISATNDWLVIQRVAEDLSLYGVAKAHISDFTSMPSLEKLKAAYEDLLRAEEATPHSRKGKSYIERLIDDDFPIQSRNDPLSEYFLNQSIAMACATYLELIPKLTSFKVWRSHQIELQERTASQNWYRDYNEYQMLRVFCYFNDVTSENGASDYIKGSDFKGDFFDKLQDPEDGLSRYSKDSDVESLSSKGAIIEAAGIAGTLVCMDTAGLHRGGFHPVPVERRVSITSYSTAAELQSTRIRKPKDFDHVSSLVDGVLV